MPPRVDYLTDAVMELAKNEKSRQVQVRSQPQGRNPAQTRRNWITRFLNCHPELALKFASRIDRQCAYAGNPHTIQTHFRKLEKVIRDNDIKDNGITNVGEKGFVMPVASLVLCSITIVRQSKTSSFSPHTASIGLCSFPSINRLERKCTLSRT